MKSILLAVALIPAVALAQTGKGPTLKNQAAPALQSIKMNGDGPVAVQGKALKGSGARGSRAFSIPFDTIGTTYYDLQTNNSIARRIIAYPDGKISVVFTSSLDQTDANFPNRGAGYVHFNGTSWSQQNQTLFETDRSGWPNLASVTQGGVAKEYIVSHYAAAGTNNTSGGTFWLTNPGVGNPAFTQIFEKDRPGGPLWPRIAASGKYIHMIAVYNNETRKAGVRSPIVYYRYNLETSAFDISDITLPGYDSTRYGAGSADEYALEARDSVVAIVMGGAVNDVALFKSINNGTTWTKTIVDSFAHAPVDLRVDNPFDTAFSNDGTVNLALDASGNAHVFFPRNRVLNEIPGDSSYSIFFDDQGIEYWNEVDRQIIRIGGLLDLDNDGQISILPATAQNTGAGYGGNNYSTFPVGAIDPQGNIYCVYNAPVETDLFIDGTVNYRHQFVVYSTDGGQTWSEPQDLTQTYGMEHVFASVAKDFPGNKLHMTWMGSFTPGIVLVNSALGVEENSILYAGINTSDITTNTIGTGINGEGVKNEVSVQILGTYPNPATNQVNAQIRMPKANRVNFEWIDINGRTVDSRNNVMMGFGPNTVNFDVSGFKAGMYILRATSGSIVSTSKVFISK